MPSDPSGAAEFADNRHVAPNDRPADLATSALVARARAYAVDAHGRQGQRRKYTKQPYAVHLKAVAELVESATDDAETIAAAWLHDTVEDTPVTLDQVEREFGAAVAALVSDLTDVSRPGDGNRATRKAIDREHTARASPRAKTVKLADLIDNCRDIRAGDPAFARVFLAEAMALLDVLGEGDPGLFRRAHREISEGFARLGLPLPPQAVFIPGGEEVRKERPFAQHRSLRLFMETLNAQDIAEPLRWFDEARPASEVRAIAESAGIDVIGMRREGSPVGYALRTDLNGGHCGAAMRDFLHGQVLEAGAPLADVVQILIRHDACFVTLFGEVAAVARRVDMNRPIVRMWLFGLVTLIEAWIAKRLRERWPEGEWQALMSPARLAKAQALLEERQRRGQSCELIDCLQLSDKGQILMQVEEERRRFDFRSKAEADAGVRNLESLRNNLAHAQDIVAHDWLTIVNLALHIEEILEVLH